MAALLWRFNLINPFNQFNGLAPLVLFPSIVFHVLSSNRGLEKQHSWLRQTRSGQGQKINFSWPIVNGERGAERSRGESERDHPAEAQQVGRVRPGERG